MRSSDINFVYMYTFYREAAITFIRSSKGY
jgi:hypothetical protein